MIDWVTAVTSSIELEGIYQEFQGVAVFVQIKLYVKYILVSRQFTPSIIDPCAVSCTLAFVQKKNHQLLLSQWKICYYNHVISVFWIQSFDLAKLISVTWI